MALDEEYLLELARWQHRVVRDGWFRCGKDRGQQAADHERAGDWQKGVHRSRLVTSQRRRMLQMREQRFARWRLGGGDASSRHSKSMDAPEGFRYGSLSWRVGAAGWYCEKSESGGFTRRGKPLVWGLK